jgi:hypothetical protein
MLLFPIVPVLFAGDNVDNEVKFAGTQVTVDNEVVAKVTSFNRSVSVKEENITGSEDVVPGTDVLHEMFTAISISETANVEGIAIETQTNGLDDGQSELKDAVESGKVITMRTVKNTGYGWSLSGFLTSYDESGDTSGVYKYKGAFRVNAKTKITPGS